MFEKVNPFHPDKVADRIAGAIVDLAYTRAEGGWAKSNPRIAVEVLIGHGVATVIIETSLNRSELVTREVEDVVRRFLPSLLPDIIIVSQDEHLSRNQQGGIRVGDNGIFKGCPVTDEQRTMMSVAKSIVLQHPSDGKYIIKEQDVIICQSNVSDKQAAAMKNWLFESHLNAVINPLGAWTGGVNVDCGATNRKLGSDMGDAVTGGGLHGKDLSKADVSVNIMCHIKAQASRQVVTACTAIGDTDVTFRYADGTKETLPFAEVVEAARLYIMTQHGSFEHFAEWGLIA
jgi:S-adenosylmethionine synthetase